jgi:hypothetical protein
MERLFGEKSMRGNRTYTHTCKTLCCWTPLRPKACVDPKQPLCDAESRFHAHGYLKRLAWLPTMSLKARPEHLNSVWVEIRSIEKSIQVLGIPLSINAATFGAAIRGLMQSG